MLRTTTSDTVVTKGNDGYIGFWQTDLLNRTSHDSTNVSFKITNQITKTLAIRRCIRANIIYENNKNTKPNQN